MTFVAIGTLNYDTFQRAINDGADQTAQMVFVLHVNFSQNMAYCNICNIFINSDHHCRFYLGLNARNLGLQIS